MSYGIGRNRLAAQVEKELESVAAFQRNIESHIASLQDSILTGSEISHGLIDGINYNKQMQKLYLERAAAKLELVALFDEDKGDCVDLATIQGKLALVRMITEVPNQDDSEPMFKGQTLEKILEDASDEGFTYIRSSLTGITQTIEEFLEEIDGEDANPNLRYGLFNKIVVCLNTMENKNAEIFELD